MLGDFGKLNPGDHVLLMPQTPLLTEPSRCPSLSNLVYPFMFVVWLCCSDSTTLCILNGLKLTIKTQRPRTQRNLPVSISRVLRLRDVLKDSGAVRQEIYTMNQHAGIFIKKSLPVKPEL